MRSPTPYYLACSLGLTAIYVLVALGAESCWVPLLTTGLVHGALGLVFLLEQGKRYKRAADEWNQGSEKLGKDIWKYANQLRVAKAFGKAGVHTLSRLRTEIAIAIGSNLDNMLAPSEAYLLNTLDSLLEIAGSDINENRMAQIVKDAQVAWRKHD